MTDKELKNIAPKLYQLKNMGSGFSVPEKYFETVETSITFDIFNTEKQQQFNTPKDYFDTIENKVLLKIKKDKESFSVPQGYFDSIEDDIFKKIHTEPKVIHLKDRFLKQLIPVVAAASLLLFISLQFFNTNDSDLFTSLKTSEIENWIANNDLDLNTYDIEAVYEDFDLESIDINRLYSDEELINYLDNIDVESLILTN